MESRLCVTNSHYDDRARGQFFMPIQGTRRDIINMIYSWVNDREGPQVFWLNGLAGTGKSYIARMIAECRGVVRKPPASFFCSRGSEENGNPKLIIPDLTFQLVYMNPPLLSKYLPVVYSGTNFKDQPPQVQMEKLLVNPLVGSTTPALILIDGLDECTDEKTVSEILAALKKFIPSIPHVKFLITSRPRRHIREGLLRLAEDHNCRVGTFALHEARSNYKDIRQFFRVEIQALDYLPCEEDLDQLCEHAGGLFVYAKAAVEFIRMRNVASRPNLRVLLNSLSNRALTMPLKRIGVPTICSLYMTALKEAFGDCEPEDYPKVRSIIGTVVLATKPLSPFTIATLLGLNANDVLFHLESIESLLIMGKGNDDMGEGEEIMRELTDIMWEAKYHPVQPFHPSFPAFLTNQDLCTNQDFHVSPPTHHKQLLVGCLKLMNEKLVENSTFTHSGVNKGAKKHTDAALEYACVSWHKHLAGTMPSVEDLSEITDHLHPFLREKLSYWWKVLCTLNVPEVVQDALEMSRKWSKVHLVFPLNT